MPNLQLTSAGRTGTANGPQIALGPHFAQVWCRAFTDPWYSSDTCCSCHQPAVHCCCTLAHILYTLCQPTISQHNSTKPNTNNLPHTMLGSLSLSLIFLFRSHTDTLTWS